ncbi:MAG: phosphatidylserine decarboxylase [Firmicutes bacterium]|nr:phosphatidylserine decarboxylase [Bacillota bacterium]NBI61533.1 phosphatidylserine decarboxylase [Clostridiales bacterium]
MVADPQRKGRRQTIKVEETVILRFLYRSVPGRALLKLLVAPAVSRLCGRFMDSRFSRRFIQGFAERHKIDPSKYEQREYVSFNDFFCRGLAQFSFDESLDSLISPCDAKLSAFPINQQQAFMIKGTPYSVADLIENRELASSYEGGICLIFRLSVDDYHRYCYIDDGTKGRNVFLPGQLHTVQPIALRRYDIYKENCREYTVMDTQHFGKVTQVEIGALLVGKIANHQQAGSFRKGEEKGMFLYGGSTIVLLLEKGKARVDEEFFENTANSLETVVKIGERIGTGISLFSEKRIE